MSVGHQVSTQNTIMVYRRHGLSRVLTTEVVHVVEYGEPYRETVLH